MITDITPKQPLEKFYQGVDWSEALPEGRTIVVCTVSALDLADGSDATGVILGSSGAAIDSTGSKTSVQLRGGTNHHRYKVTFRATLDDGEILEEDLTVVVEDS